MYFLVGTNAKQFLNIPKEKYFTLLIIKSFINPFVDITLTIFDSSSN